MSWQALNGLGETALDKQDDVLFVLCVVPNPHRRRGG